MSIKGMYLFIIDQELILQKIRLMSMMVLSIEVKLKQERQQSEVFKKIKTSSIKVEFKHQMLIESENHHRYQVLRMIKAKHSYSWDLASKVAADFRKAIESGLKIQKVINLYCHQKSMK